MTASPIWEPSGLSSTRHSSIFDLSHSRDGPSPNGRVCELNKSSINMDHHVRQLPGTTYLPPIYGAVGLRRSPPYSFVGLPTVVPNVIGCRFPLPLSKNSHPDYPTLVRQGLFSPLDTSYFCSPAVPAPQPDKVMRPFQPSSFTSPAPLQMPMYLNSTYASILPKRSKAALAVEDWDHPSFARPPHRAFEPQGKDDNDHSQSAENQMNINHVQHTSSAMDANMTVGDEPLVPSLYPVPPPPPYEQSAAPLSDLAADIVWQRCYFPKTRPSASPIGLTNRPWESALPWSPSHGYHLTNVHLNQPSEFADSSVNWSGSTNTYGAIGAEAKARRFNRQFCSSVSPLHLDNSNGLSHCRKLSIGTKTEVKPAFRRWTRQVLEQTLLSPQVLILALYYIDCVASMDVFGDANSKLSLLPYKMLLSALVVANKTLDDHSYRNSTFANVSSMTNTEVNAIEVALLSSLNFNVVPTSDQWTSWLKEVINTGERLGFHDPHLGLHSPLSRLVSSQQSTQQAENLSSEQLGDRSVRQGSIFDQVPTPDYTWPSNSGPLANVFDLKHFSSSAPSDMHPLDLHTQHTPVAFQFSREYAGSHSCADFVSHSGDYLKRSYPHYR